jgi:hypothetical protein
MEKQTVKAILIHCLAIVLLTGGAALQSGCGVPGGGFPNGGNGDGGNGGNGNGGNGNGDNGDGGNGGSSPVSGNYNPASQLVLTTNGLTLTVPPGATLTPVTLTIQSASAVMLPAVLPGGVELAGGSFQPNGQAFLVPATVTTTLSAPTIARALPVLTFDVGKNRWVGAGIGSVAANGTDVTFELSHFSLAGVPDPLPVPLPGNPLDPLVTIPNNGMFSSSEITSNSATLFYSESAGGSMVINATSITVDEFGQPQTVELSLFGVQVVRVDRRVVAEIGGQGSFFPTADF